MKKIYLLAAVAFLLTININSRAQIINTFAGTGVPAYGGDGGAPIAAKLNNPGGIFIDAGGIIYIADRNNNCIRKIAGGIISTIAGTTAAGYTGDGGPATNATFYHPIQIAKDPSGNLLVVDCDNSVIRKISTSGIISTIAGTGVPGYNGDGINATAAKLNVPIGLFVDGAGNIIVGDLFNQRIRKINPAGIISTIAGTGTSGYSGDGFAATSAKLHNPNYLTADPSGNIFVSDNGNHCIRKISTSGIISTVAGNGSGGYTGDGVAATTSELLYPAGLRVDVAGNLFIADNGNSRIRKVDIAGIITTVAGNGIAGYAGDGAPATSAEIYQPTDVCTGPGGVLYIADYWNSRVRIVGNTNNAPTFTGGHNQNVSLCINTITSIDTLLKIMDADSGQPENWSLYTPPVHGAATVTYAATSTGSAIIPTGLLYTPTTGYTGTDMFKVIINDGIASDTTTINVTVDPLPSAGVISGIDSVCPGYTVALSETVTGGIWSSSDAFITQASHTGHVKGLIPGRDTVIYTVINACGIVSAIFPFTVRPYGSCPSLNIIDKTENDNMGIYPNPNSGNFTLMVQTANDEQVKISVVNMLGQHVTDVNIPSNKSMDMSIEVPTGMYLLTATTSDKQWSKRIMINSGR